MSFFRSMLAVLAAAAIASPVYAADDASAAPTADQSAASSITTSDASAAQAEKVNVNTATVKQLTKVKGISKANAKAIIAYRKAHGNFQNINDLTANVKGLSNLKPTTLDQLTVE